MLSGRFGITKCDGGWFEVSGEFATHPAVVAAVRSSGGIFAGDPDEDVIVRGDILWVRIATPEGYGELNTLVNRTANDARLGASVILFWRQ
jgi:hypothetical protein